MTNTPSPDEDRELIEHDVAWLRERGYSTEKGGDEEIFYRIAARLESLLADRAKLEGDWFDKAIRDHADEHGPSGGAWNISMVLERLHRARSALNRSTDRAT